MKTLKASRKCAKWLQYCLSIGWKKRHLEGLEKVWWMWHNEETGELQTPEKYNN